MKKIPTLFKRVFENNKIVGINNEVTEGFEWVLAGDGYATIKWDGSCCAIMNGELYKRYDAKKGKKPPEGAIPCCEPDSITGHHPHWVKCDRSNPSDKWFFAALDNSAYVKNQTVPFKTYEAIGKHFQGNPYNSDKDILMPHGEAIVKVDDSILITKDEYSDYEFKPMPKTRSFESIRKWLEAHTEEGIVFWKDGEPQCKIKRSDFGLEYPCKEWYQHEK